MAQILELQSAEVGTIITFTFPDIVSTQNVPISGGTVTLNVSPPVTRGTSPVVSYTCQNQSDGYSAQYTTTGTDFVTVGNWTAQAVLQNGLGKHHGPEFTIKILPNVLS